MMPSCGFDCTEELEKKNARPINEFILYDISQVLACIWTGLWKSPLGSMRHGYRESTKASYEGTFDVLECTN